MSGWLVLFDGSVSYPDLSVLWKILDREKVTAFGASPKYFSACMQNDIIPRDIMENTGVLETMLSTGSPLLPEHFHWVKEKVGENIHLASICGGTDIISCFILGNPSQPVYEGEIQCRGLGMAVESWNDEGRAVLGERGELVCTKPFVSMPVGFWNDPQGTKYKSAYFEHYHDQQVWRERLPPRAVRALHPADFIRQLIQPRHRLVERKGLDVRGNPVDRPCRRSRASRAGG